VAPPLEGQGGLPPGAADTPSLGLEHKGIFHEQPTLSLRIQGGSCPHGLELGFTRCQSVAAAASDAAC